MKKYIDFVGVKLVKETPSVFNKIEIDNSDKACEVAKLLLEDCAEENIIVLMLNTKHKIVSVSFVAKGTLNSCIIHPREVFKTAILANASAIIIAHNHPSGDVTPSNEDKEMTRRIKQCGDILGVELIDSIVVSPHDYFSFSKEELL